MNWHPPRAVLISWLALLGLLGLTVFIAYQPLGSFNTGIALAIATTKALLVAVFFMELATATGLTFVFAGAGFFWLAIMLWLAFSDYITRPSPIGGL
jgi:cytochrome c oxidase subunit 4